MRIQVPAGWRAGGELPPFDPAAASDLTEAQLDALTEDLWSASTPDERFTIDIGWYPEADAGGHFRCRLVESATWDQPREEFCTRSLGDAGRWADSTVQACRALMPADDPPPVVTVRRPPNWDVPPVMPSEAVRPTQGGGVVRGNSRGLLRTKVTQRAS
jgi:hypothetical protein